MEFKNIKDLIEKGNSEKSDKKRANRQIDDSFEFIKLISHWNKIVGDEFAKNSLPIKNQFNTLTILTSHPIYSKELSLKEKSIKNKIHSMHPILKKQIKIIKFTAKSSFFNQEKKKKQIKKPKKQPIELHKHSPEYKRLKAKADEIFFYIEDKKIKNTMISIYIQNHLAEI